MHELGVVIEVVKRVESIARENQLAEVETIVLQIGELSSMIPKYVKECFPAAVDGTRLEKTKLEIEIIPANAMCKGCREVFNILQSRSVCPHCESREWGLLSGKEFLIKEIVAC
ncbi:hydrogenase maturation nickel metallochaperone HypA [Vibrio sp. JC009]|uniref:hydrogenase maturation nickel metallochaperone HypA/HybF n=1 Tax=Vibrio sp. JC009 TaxID=2912314 RepID=UPI0023B1D3ED|nr:hydrogenase maturation nickel metallochaperone HypA [Vibrio sp. JC009]WED24279.1 hydrogenase maturation nickel metallochaperone HypA [Vibrio sp. JC009]